MSSIGGLMAKLSDQPITRRNVTLALLVCAPFLITPIELQLPVNDTYHTVENEIIIEADVDAVWQNIASVPLIGEDEQSFSLFHWWGLPKPLEATLSYAGVGGVRDARFEGGLIFVETVTEWEPQRTFSFTIVENSKTELPAPLNLIGGNLFDVTEGTYIIERLDEDTVRLHLSSQHRLSTRLNRYGSIWTTFVMSDLQNYILQIIKARAEAGFIPSD